MARFNEKPKSLEAQVGDRLANRPDATRNLSGGVAFRLSVKAELYQRVLSCLLGEPKFYEDANTTAKAIERLAAEVAAGEPEWVLRLAAYARQEMNLRTVSIFLLVLAAELPACKPFVRRWAPAIIRRADEPGEVIAAWVSRHGPIGEQGKAGGEHAFPNSLKKGIADALLHFDEYQLEKYNRDGAVKLKDVLGICRPNPGGRQALYKYLRWGWDRLTDDEKATLPKLTALNALAEVKNFGPGAVQLAAEAHATWEVLISQFGNKREVWDALTLPFMAGLRNLRNLLTVGSNAALPIFLDQLRNEQAVRRSKQFPFRFLSAYREVQRAGGTQANAALGALSAAMQHSLANLPRWKGRTLIASDNSGSMDKTLSDKTAVTRLDIANMMGAMANSLSDDPVVVSFGSNLAPVVINPADSVFTNAERIRTAEIKERGTNGFLVLAYLRGYRAKGKPSMHNRPAIELVKTHEPIFVDRIFMSTDGELHNTGGNGEGRYMAQQLELYRREVNPNCRVYVNEIGGYGTTQVLPNDPLSVTVAGWSEKILSFIPLFEQGMEVGVATIDGYQPGGVALEMQIE